MTFKLCKYNPEIILHCIFPGAYVPLTVEGNIVFDGELASCYPSTYHDLTHTAMTPVQWFPNIIDWIIGEKNGFSIFVTITEDVGRWVLPDDDVSFE